VPVYNVAMPLMKRSFPDAPPFRVLDLGPEQDPAPVLWGGLPR
jgi:hypothetical protein